MIQMNPISLSNAGGISFAGTIPNDILNNNEQQQQTMSPHHL